MHIFEKKIILASQSPRRKQLMEQAGFSFTIHPLHIDESFPEDMDVYKVADYLAQKKARAGKHLLQGEEILITADSVVILEGRIYNKPESREEAVYMLKKLSGNMHEVMTGVCLLSREKERVFAGHSRVYMDALSAEEIDFYIEKYQPFDKAGAYGIQEWIGLCKIQRIEGTYANVMGLPTDLLYKNLIEF
jgi:septum formation protein